MKDRDEERDRLRRDLELSKKQMEALLSGRAKKKSATSSSVSVSAFLSVSSAHLEAVGTTATERQKERGDSSDQPLETHQGRTQVR
jgi:hypothetical protein